MGDRGSVRQWGREREGGGKKERESKRGRCVDRIKGWKFELLETWTYTGKTNLETWTNLNVGN